MTAAHRRERARWTVWKWKLPRSISGSVTASIAGESHAPMLSGRVEKPPVETAANAWLTASNALIPAST